MEREREEKRLIGITEKEGAVGGLEDGKRKRGEHI